jgi:hypothetical protein
MIFNLTFYFLENPNPKMHSFSEEKENSLGLWLFSIPMGPLCKSLKWLARPAAAMKASVHWLTTTGSWRAADHTGLNGQDNRRLSGFYDRRISAGEQLESGMASCLVVREDNKLWHRDDGY